MNHLVIDDPGVSRMHAWIDGEGDDRYYINDAGSRTGTRVNGQRIVARHLLADEDEIAIGPAKLTFLAESTLRAGVDPIDLASPPKVAAAENGIPFDCPSCKAPLWASANFAGGAGKCKCCGNDVVVPKSPAATGSRNSSGRFSPAPGTSGAGRGGLDGGRAVQQTPSLALPRSHHEPSAHPRSMKGTDHRHVIACHPEHSKGSLGVAAGRDPSQAQDDGLRPSAPFQSSTGGGNKAANIFLTPNKPPVKPPPAPAPLPTASPGPPAKPTPSLRRNSDGEQMCGVCQSAISVFEEQTSCPCCGLVFHADCWAENYGCSAYGCPQVNALAPRREHDHAVLAATHGAEASSDNATTDLAAVGDGATDKPARFPWEFLLLAGSVFSALVGASRSDCLRSPWPAEPSPTWPAPAATATPTAGLSSSRPAWPCWASSPASPFPGSSTLAGHS